MFLYFVYLIVCFCLNKHCAWTDDLDKIPEKGEVWQPIVTQSAVVWVMAFPHSVQLVL